MYVEGLGIGIHAKILKHDPKGKTHGSSFGGCFEAPDPLAISVLRSKVTQKIVKQASYPAQSV